MFYIYETWISSAILVLSLSVALSPSAFFHSRPPISTTVSLISFEQGRNSEDVGS